MSDNNDPRVYFAAERTLLAWVRTGLAVIGLGFVVARFGLFLRALKPGDGSAQQHVGSTAIGVLLVLLGSVSIAIAARQHLQFSQNLKSIERPTPNLGQWSVWFAGSLAMIGTFLAIYLLIRTLIG